jgi:protein-S-isoprenylcysteine O-methyltransferase Ste14
MQRSTAAHPSKLISHCAKKLKTKFRDTRHSIHGAFALRFGDCSSSLTRAALDTEAAFFDYRLNIHSVDSCLLSVTTYLRFRSLADIAAYSIHLRVLSTEPVSELIGFQRQRWIMWLGEPVLILAISVTVLGVLFAIRRILARAPVQSSSDRRASDGRESRGIAGVIAPPPLIFLGFLALAAVLEAIIPTPTTALFPYVRYVAGTVLFIIGLVIGIAGIQGLRASGTNISTDLPATALVVDGIYRWSRNPLYLAVTLAYVGLAIAAGALGPSCSSSHYWS